VTQAQSDALERITDIMLEHFNSGITTVVCDQDDESRDEEIHCSWHGGYANAFGLLELGKLQMLSEREQNYGRGADL